MLNHVLHREITDQTGDPRFQIVLPRSCCQAVIKLVHSTPMSGHVGFARTEYKIMQHFFWPGISKDVRAACQACDRCQCTAKRTHSRAPMINPMLPTMLPITRPFAKVAINIVGPLPLTTKKDMYMLMYVDLGSRFPDAVSLKTTIAKVIAQSLLTISLLSPQKSFLTGSNFMSALMTPSSE